MKNLIFFIFLSFSHILNGFNFWETVSQNKLSSYLDAKLAQQYNGIVLPGYEDASLRYQQLGKEAQEKLEITPENQLPIRRESSVNPQTQNKKPVAHCSINDIIVNEQRLDERPYGAQRLALFHEACHKKDNIIINRILINLASLVTILPVNYLLSKKIPWINKNIIFKGLASLVMTNISIKMIECSYRKQAETHADTIACLEGNCYKCVEEFNEARKQYDQKIFKKDGYLTVDEIQPILNKLKSKNCLCSHHQQNQNPL